MRNMFNGALLFAVMSMAAIGTSAQDKVEGGNVAASQQQTADLDAKYAASLLNVGTEAPEIALKTIDGKPFSLKSLRGKYVVLDFWASWCPDCRKDAPNVVDMYNKFHQKGVEFVGVSFDKKIESWKSGVEKLNIPYTQVSDLKNMRESAVAQAYGIQWIPSVYVIDPEGNVALATVMSDKANAFLHSIYPDCAE